MQEIVYHSNFEIENSYWWFVARNRIVLDAFKKLSILEHGKQVLDVGCGTGGFASMLNKDYDVLALDMSETALNYCKQRGIEKRFNMFLHEFPKEKWNVEAITMLDVIEHIDDDQGVVKDVYNVLPSGGSFMATVPAYEGMWSTHDEIHMHKRRYTRKQFVALLTEAGFEVKYATYFNSFLLLPAYLKRTLDRITKGDHKDKPPVDEVSPLLNTIFTKIFLLENKIIPKLSMPMGLSIMVYAEKK